MWPISLGIAAAVATIVGALLVGDSLRGSLRFLALDRIGRIEFVLLAPNFFDVQTLSRTEPNSTPIILFPATSIEIQSLQEVRRASGVVSMGIDDTFWKLGGNQLAPTLQKNQIAINQAVADELAVKIGDRLTMQVPAQSAVSSDNPLGKRDSETVALGNLELVAILPNEGLARFDLQSSQRISLNAFVSAATIQDALSRPLQFNAALYATSNLTNGRTEADLKTSQSSASEILRQTPLQLSDLGIAIERHTASVLDAGDTPAFDYYQLTSDRLLVPDPVIEVVQETLGLDSTMVLLTYLANGISISIEPSTTSAINDKAKAVVPYSTITGVDPASIGPNAETWQLRSEAIDSSQSLDADDCLVNSWLAENLGLNIGDRLQIDYFQSENENGHEVERSFEATVKGIVPITKPTRSFRRNRPASFETESPTAFNDSSMTPTVAGITDQDSISDWNTPFPLTRTVRSEDDEYWQDYRLTPKLFLSLDNAKKLFGSRFGNASSIRIDPKVATSVEELVEKLTPKIQGIAPELGWQVLPLAAQQLQAANGSTPFDALFLSLSFFVIAASLMLIFLLMRLAVETRSSQWGLLQAGGWTVAKVRRLILSESALVVVFGSLIGLGLGVAFCLLILDLLRGRWVGAVGVPFLSFHWSWRSILLGLLIGGGIAFLTIWISVYFLFKQKIVDLLRGNSVSGPSQRQKNTPWFTLIALSVSALLVIILPNTSDTLEGPAKAGAFLGAGMFALVAMILLFQLLVVRRYRFGIPGFKSSGSSKAEVLSFSFGTLVSSSLQRNPLRSLLAVSLIAIASFLILCVSLFHVEPDLAGTGGFSLMAQTNLSVSRDLNDEQVRRNALGEQAAGLTDTRIVGMRLRGGDYAGCSNLYQANQPQVLGMSPLIQSIDVNPNAKNGTNSNFAWAAVAEVPEGLSVWSHLEKRAVGTADDPIPVIIDQNTAMWGLHLAAGIGEVFHYQYDQNEVYFRTVGLLQNTILQGSLIIGETNFTDLFPDVSGQRVFLVRCDSQRVAEVSATLEKGWANEGMDAKRSDLILRELLAVQNTYLRAFQSLGALGLVLGTLGLAVIQIRSVVERQSEFGVLRAIGFSAGRIAKTLMAEHLVLLGGGTLIGLLAAMLSVALASGSGQSVGELGWPLLMLSLVFFFGMIAGAFAVQKVNRMSLLSSLRAQ